MERFILRIQHLDSGWQGTEQRSATTGQDGVAKYEHLGPNDHPNSSPLKLYSKSTGRATASRIAAGCRFQVWRREIGVTNQRRADDLSMWTDTRWLYAVNVPAIEVRPPAGAPQHFESVLLDDVAEKRDRFPDPL